MRDNYIVTVNWRVDSLEGEGGGGSMGEKGGFNVLSCSLNVYTIVLIVRK